MAESWSMEGHVPLYCVCSSSGVKMVLMGNSACISAKRLGSTPCKQEALL